MSPCQRTVGGCILAIRKEILSLKNGLKKPKPSLSVVPNAKIDGVRCPCAYCWNCKLQNKVITQLHLCKYGFKENYEVWIAHGGLLASQNQPTPSVEANDQMDRIYDMVADFNDAHHTTKEEGKAYIPTMLLYLYILIVLCKYTYTYAGSILCLLFSTWTKGRE